MASSFTLSLNPKPILLSLSNSRKLPASALSTLPFLLLSRLHSRTRTCCAPPSRNDLLWLREEQRWLREEQRWLREEQRWLREEQRWLREEQRWARERESLLGEIRSLKLRVQSPGDGGVLPLLEVLPEKNLIPQSGQAVAGPMLLEEGVASVPHGEVAGDKAVKGKLERQTLRMGSEGAEVREMQEALQKLGFYSGEEDMEFSSFSSGTHDAVQTWQASLGAIEDGIMTAEHLELLLTTQGAEFSEPTQFTYRKESTPTRSEKKGVNGAAVGSIAEIAGVEKKAVKEGGKTDNEVSHNRVFLLGENRWEDPSRLGRQDKMVGDDTATGCLSCHGEGSMLCAECDGTGEPNVEPQFMEWIDEKLKCPYCVGLGYTACDVCGGKATN